MLVSKQGPQEANVQASQAQQKPPLNEVNTEDCDVFLLWFAPFFKVEENLPSETAWIFRFPIPLQVTRSQL